jgi:hypothetical protein
MSVRNIAKAVLPRAAVDLIRAARQPAKARTPASAQISKHSLFEIQRDEANKRLFDLGMAHLWSAGGTGDGDYYEFGICGAGQFRTALAAAAKWGLDKMQLRAFDSFEGLPGTGHLAMSHADFLASVRGTGLDCSRVHTYPGFFADSLTSGLQRELLSTGRPARFVNVDCDLHDSAVEVFRFIDPLLRPGSIVYVDDYFTTFFSAEDRSHGGSLWGTAQAFHDFEASYRYKFVPFMDVGYWGKAFLAYDPALVPLAQRRG